MGFAVDLLANIYRSITLSQYLYNAPLLTSASKAAKMAMDKQQQRFFKLIGINTETAWRVYQIPSIDIYIDEQCVKCVERMLDDPDHPITLKTSKKDAKIQEARVSYHLDGTQNATTTALSRKLSALSEMVTAKISTQHLQGRKTKQLTKQYNENET